MSASVTTTRSTLMHAALAHVSPELREFDLLAFGRLRPNALSQRRSLSSIPPELLLLIRSALLPLLISDLIKTSAASLRLYETSLRRLVCPQCTYYNEYVYGHDIWTWHLSGPCSCVGEGFNTPTMSAVRLPNPKQFRDRHHWLETYLSRKSLRFRGLPVTSSSSSAAIWDVVANVLRDYDCEAVRRGLGRGVGMALLSRWDRQAILVVALRQKGNDSQTPRLLLRRATRDLGLCWAYSEPYQLLAAGFSHEFLTTLELSHSTRLQCASDRLIATLLMQILDTIAAPLTAILFVPLSCATLLFTVLCYYSKPGALRLL
ncbi:hypothetical protein C8J57DRAFT_7477 [Mycena rebaudengoi]|nr:hypothetical protein C8J57DRAFT_7477 [Mycena rebaudengoi]